MTESPRRDDAAIPLDLVDLPSPTEERNPASSGLDALDSRGMVDVILAEDAKVATAVQQQAERISELVEVCVSAIAGGRTVHYVGAGTSGRLGVLDAVELAPTFNADDSMVTAHLAGGPGAFMTAVEGAEDDPEAGAAMVREVCQAGDVVIGLAASGRTPFVRGALQAAREAGMPTALISANPRAELAGEADIAILPDVGPEVVTGSTRMKAGTAQKLTLNALSTATMVRLGTTFGNLMIDVRPTNAKLVGRTVRMLVQASGESAERAGEVLEAAEGSVRVALVALLSGADVERAAAALSEHPRDPQRIGDPAGIRSAVDALTTED
ncbi:MAG: N-acetylmuramic acid 6-phosphate etherase [Brachybacterium alimentarium]|uniref:N-acetylmuramic acid 6-phosphate etherase n=1 Tax=Brachybacterium alimentarium TaxID=47845 RepID=A0A2A3YNJ5_9MICO|nr:N-acetylmuramic acid 6-phosphate etherase [Brachybacterium alimentarium]PCC32999.1 N-acetylmuramic acid 6-phosphate etherase [Brachybacterium alimentarium]PCC40870.1 N-acetylmuramic acid 6-phosphate etherase [Brachybacterium alimentarium]RCS83253.1 N-acetylmuramic acid 6-phosphate etherase [Brachybacterium alimentarium]